MSRFKELYDGYYIDGYRDKIIAYEVARYTALDHFIRKVLKLNNANKLLDYGSGSGLHVGLWRRLFPNTELHFCDISEIALEKLKKKYPEYNLTCGVVKNSRAPFKDEFFDVIVSIEVIEHVEDINKYFDDIYRLLKRGGLFIWSTPCANPFSIEHLYGFFSNQIEKTKEGYSKWKWEDPTHIRRFKSKEIKNKLLDFGFVNIGFKFRAHFFSFICVNFFQGFLRKIGEQIMLLDYMLFRKFPNGASMIGSAYKI